MPGVVVPGPHKAAGAHPATSGSTGMSFWWLMGCVTSGVCLGAAGPGCFRLPPPALVVPAILLLHTPLSYKLRCVCICVCISAYENVHIPLCRNLANLSP